MFGHKRWNFLIDQVRKNGYAKGVEIGVKAGRTTRELLSACPKLKMWAIDPWRESEVKQINDKGEEKVYSGPGWEQGAHDRSEKTARSNLGAFGDRCTIIKGFSVEEAAKFEDETFDFVFIDGLHSYDGCKGDIYSWLRKIRSGGMLSGHDINWPGVKQAVEESFGDYSTATDNVWYVII